MSFWTLDRQGLSVKQQSPEPADNELTTKSQLLSSNRVIASAMLSIPVQAWKWIERQKQSAVSGELHKFWFLCSCHRIIQTRWQKEKKNPEQM